MPDLRGLTLVVTTGDVERFRAALTLACAQAALGGRVRVFAHERAVGLFTPASDPGDEALPALGFATRHQLLNEARDAGVIAIVCQTGLGAAGLRFDQLPDGVQAGGLVSLLADLGDDRLLAL